MGWMGMARELEYALSVVGADKDEDGKYKIYGNPGCITSFMGAGEELVVDDSAMYSVDGKKCSVAGLLNSTSYGLRNVKVF